MTKTTRVAALAAMAAFCAPGVTEAGASQAQPAVAAPSPPQEFAQGDPAFYTVPDPIPAGDHGDLIRFQVIDSAFTHRYRIMYLSQTMAGAPTVVTALVEVDEAAAPFGGYPVLLHGHGTTGMADVCSPSLVIDGDIADGDHASEFESIGNATSSGWAVVSTDYEGIGGPGSHPMLVGVSEGRSMLERRTRRPPGPRRLPRHDDGDRRILPGWTRCAVGRPARYRVDA